ncbi:TetR/AcrR family transcriptional regulator [Aquimarina sp. AU474]|uniref:TetR/AcrR family transcriptional regulator n=1 Tax=Aquimarina sp. AU474 TaxID=2108529 RepID=UPI000D685B6E|nr:TetR/AcrR family transcriptional regulator [Aquimarina sp. AU474]
MKKEGVQERIVRAASKLFYFDGYNQTGINRILQEAKVSKDSMYRHFRSKEDIAVAYLQRRHTMWMGMFLEHVNREEKGADKIIASFDFLRDWMIEVNYRGCGFQNIICDLPKEQQKINDQVVLHKNGLKNWIHATLKEESKYEDANVNEFTDEVMVLIEGSIILSQIQKDVWPITSAQRNCKRLLK